MTSRRLLPWLVSAALAASGVVHAAPVAYAITSDDGDRLVQVDLATGSATTIGELPTVYEDVEGLALGSNGVLYGIDDATKTLVQIDPATAAVQIPGVARSNTGLPTGVSQALDPGLTFSCDGSLLLSTRTGRLYRVSPQTGVATAIGGGGATMVENITDIAARGANVYGLGATDLYLINPGTGSSTRIGAYGSGVSFADGGGMAFDASGQLWAVADRSLTSAASQIYRLDPLTGKATAAGSTAARGIESLSIRATDCTPAAMGIASIPVPGSAPTGLGFGVLLLAGLGLAALRRPR